MTTTTFRIDKNNIARMGSDSRVSWVTNKGLVVRVFDSPSYFKVANINGVLYGFAGTNFIFRKFLESYTDVVLDSNKVLDTLVALAHHNRIQFCLLRYDGELREFANSPAALGEKEIFLDSKSPPLQTKYHAIGSGRGSKMYNKNKTNNHVCLPIRKIIGANVKTLNKKQYAAIKSKIGVSDFTEDEAIAIFHACDRAGGDIFTGGEIRIMEKQRTVTTQEAAAKQVQILKRIDGEAKSRGVVCASPINAAKEIAQLQNLGVAPVRKGGIDPSIKKSAMYKSMEADLKETFNY